MPLTCLMLMVVIPTPGPVLGIYISFLQLFWHYLESIASLGLFRSEKKLLKKGS